MFQSQIQTMEENKKRNHPNKSKRIDEFPWKTYFSESHSSLYQSNRSRPKRHFHVNFLQFITTLYCLPILLLLTLPTYANAKLADRSRLVTHRKEASIAVSNMNSRLHTSHGVTKSTNPYKNNLDLPVDGTKYRRNLSDNRIKSISGNIDTGISSKKTSWKLDLEGLDVEALTLSSDIPNPEANDPPGNLRSNPSLSNEFENEESRRRLSQLTGCCETYAEINAFKLCSKYGQDCYAGQEPSHDSGDGDCSQAGLSFIGVSFSVNTAYGNPYSYQLCDQFPMENIIDRNYDYIMSMDEDGWLVGGGYKSFDYSGKMPYIDSSHTELIRIGSLDPEYGGTSISQVYEAMASISFHPFSVFPEYVKGGGGGSGDGGDSVPSSDVTLIVSIVEEFSDGNGDSDYDIFLDDIFDAMDAVGGGPCMDDHDTDPHVSMSRGVKFKSSYHESSYFYSANLEVAIWQSMYPNGAVIGANTKANFPPNDAGRNRKYVGYGNLYFFFDRANITKAFGPSRALSDDEYYYATLYEKGGASEFYESVSSINFNYNSGSGDNNNYEHNPYSWDATMAMHDMTDGWDLPPNCDQEGEAFFGIPMSRNSQSNLVSSSSFQSQFDFEVLLDRNFTYMNDFGTNHGWLVGEQIGNGAGSIVDKDTAHIPLFYVGTTNPNMGGMSLADIVSIAKNIEFGTLYVKPAFLFQDDDGSVKLQFEADANSALGYLYDNLCKMIGISWNYDSPANNLGKFTNCAMHAAGDRAIYGCGPENGNRGGFCPQMTLAYKVSFQSDDAASEFLQRGNNYVNYWRALYPSGVAVGTQQFCPSGGCLGLFLNRYDLFNVFKPDLGGSWVEYNGGTVAPTISPAPSYSGGCHDSRNSHLDKCFRKTHRRSASAVIWRSLGAIGQFSVILLMFMSSTIAGSLFLTRAKKKKFKNETYLQFLVRDLRQKEKKKKKKLKKSKKILKKELHEDILAGDSLAESSRRLSSSKSKESSRSIKRSRSKTKSIKTKDTSESSGRSRSKSKKRSSRSKSRSKGEKKKNLDPTKKSKEVRQLV